MKRIRHEVHVSEIDHCDWAIAGQWLCPQKRLLLQKLARA
jgi:hypothetical protein